MAELLPGGRLVETPALCSTTDGITLVSSNTFREDGCSPCSEISPSKFLLGCKERDPKVNALDIVAALSAELEKERKKNAELMERISLLEAQIQYREKASLPAAEQDGFLSTTHKSLKKLKKQKIEQRNNEVREIEPPTNAVPDPQIYNQLPSTALEGINKADRVVNWMSMDEAQFLNFEKYKDDDSAIVCGDTNESDDHEYHDEDYSDIGHKEGDEEDVSLVMDASPHLICNKVLDGCRNGDEKHELLLSDSNMKGLEKFKRNIIKKLRKQNSSLETQILSQEVGNKGSTNNITYRKPLKVPFCPKEVRRIMESEVLQLKNAQSHTIRKIIVFASLGIRHGCEDMYELDFNHFKIIRKGEPFVSPKDPGEHVLYERPCVQRKIFYPNRQNPLLCPVQVLEEEKAMRPFDPSCPSCLFLCIKYGGRTRNLPRNEYVRQRMGRNKLKSFGPLMCQMALLIHIRSGSFFFKALGITLLFMAGFPDDLVQRETKYRNLDLLQKYYRSDDDVKGEELFRPYPTTYEIQASPNAQESSGKALPFAPRSCGKKQTPPITKFPNPQISSSVTPTISSTSTPTAQFQLTGYSTSIPTQAVSALQLSHTPTGLSVTVGQAPPPYPMFPPYALNTFPPLSFWHNANAYTHCLYPSSYGYQSVPHSVNYVSHHSQPYCSHPCHSFLSKGAKGAMKKDAALEAASSDSDNSSSSTEPKT